MSVIGPEFSAGFASGDTRAAGEVSGGGAGVQGVVGVTKRRSTAWVIDIRVPNIRY